MTRRDYVLIADILRQFKSAPDHPRICKGFADVFGMTTRNGEPVVNLSFDKALFLRNCGVTA